MKASKQELKFVRHEDDVRALGWTYLGDIDYKQTLAPDFFGHIKAQLWCKEGKFALMNIIPGTGQYKFHKFIRHEEALRALYPLTKHYEESYQSQHEFNDKIKQTKKCSNCGKVLEAKKKFNYYLEKGSSVYVYCSHECKAEHRTKL